MLLNNEPVLLLFKNKMKHQYEPGIDVATDRPSDTPPKLIMFRIRMKPFAPPIERKKKLYIHTHRKRKYRHDDGRIGN